MKKVTVLLFVCLLAFSGVVYASVNGEYKGNPIVYVYVNGQKYNGDVPAITLNGTTMVPVRFVSESLGADVKWDTKSYSVNISSNNNPISTTTNADIIQLKEYSQYQYYFNQLNNLGSNLVGLATDLSVIFYHIDLYNDLDAYNQTNNYLNGLIDIYNRLEKSSVFYSKESTSIKSILKSYYDSIENYKAALDSLYYYSLNKTQINQNSYHNYTSKAQENAITGDTLANSSYIKYYQLIQKY